MLETLNVFGFYTKMSWMVLSCESKMRNFKTHSQRSDDSKSLILGENSIMGFQWKLKKNRKYDKVYGKHTLPVYDVNTHAPVCCLFVQISKRLVLPTHSVGTWRLWDSYMKSVGPKLTINHEVIYVIINVIYVWCMY